MKQIILIGPRHCGKTSAGRALAKLLAKAGRIEGGRAAFVDLDELMKIQTGKTPGELLAEGHEVFQEAECSALLSALESGTPVVSTGGGFCDNDAALRLLAEKKNDGLCILKVYIEVSTATAWKRIKTKPLPLFLQTDNPEASHKDIHERRAAVYKNLADIVIDGEGIKSDEIAMRIFRNT
jgi:shikimate kinase